MGIIDYGYYRFLPQWMMIILLTDKDIISFAEISEKVHIRLNEHLKNEIYDIVNLINGKRHLQ